MTRWLEAAQKAFPFSDKTDLTDKTYANECKNTSLQPEIGDLSFKSVLSEGGMSISEPAQATPPPIHNNTQQEQSQPTIRLIFNQEWTPDTTAKPDDVET